MRFDVNTIFWEQNEDVGFRQIKVRSADRTIAVINANRNNNVWTCAFVPMGFSFSTSEMDMFEDCINKSQVLMKVLSKVDCTLQEVEDTINELL